jgi:hypothetical protein
MLVLPGPGLLLMGMAIAVLALEFDWARRLADAAARTARGLAQRVGLSRLGGASSTEPSSKPLAASSRPSAPPPD